LHEAGTAQAVPAERVSIGGAKNSVDSLPRYPSPSSRQEDTDSKPSFTRRTHLELASQRPPATSGNQAPGLVPLRPQIFVSFGAVPEVTSRAFRIEGLAVS